MTDHSENTDETDLIQSIPVAGKSGRCVLHTETRQTQIDTSVHTEYKVQILFHVPLCDRDAKLLSITEKDRPEHLNRFLHYCKTPYATTLLGVSDGSDVSKENSEQGRIFHSSDTARDMRKLMRILGNVSVYNSNTNKHTAI